MSSYSAVANATGENIEGSAHLIQERIYRIAEELDGIIGDDLTDVDFAALVDRLAAPLIPIFN
ncbi:hypothetical protein [Paenarthrobacter nicotinovorans]|uniref:hypothetical protein n=1 Tax=Paenarthrobacter nicotinovorans TaxID=29320 RepID=UPI003D57EFD6